MIKKFYIYEWYNTDTNEIFYVGKGCNNRARSTRSRNRLFKDYLMNNNCSHRIVEYFDTEDEAFKAEYEKICFLKEHGQCKCNLDNGGVGGKNLVWTPEMKEYRSKYNPMKREDQKVRMSLNNPMKNKNIVQQVVSKKQRSVIIENKLFSSVKEASIYYKVFDTEIIHWCKRGYDRNKKPCRYANEEQKSFILKTTNSKKVIVDDKYFSSVREAAKYLNVWSETIIRAIKNNRKVYKHTVKYDNQQPSLGLNDL